MTTVRDDAKKRRWSFCERAKGPLKICQYARYCRLSPDCNMKNGGLMPELTVETAGGGIQSKCLGYEGKFLEKDKEMKGKAVSNARNQ